MLAFSQHLVAGLSIQISKYPVADAVTLHSPDTAKAWHPYLNFTPMHYIVQIYQDNNCGKDGIWLDQK